MCLYPTQNYLMIPCVSITMSQLFSLAFKLLYKEVPGPTSSPTSQHSHFHQTASHSNHQRLFSTFQAQWILQTVLRFKSSIQLLRCLSHLTFRVPLPSCSSQRFLLFKIFLDCSDLINPSSIIYLFVIVIIVKARDGSCLQGTCCLVERQK